MNTKLKFPYFDWVDFFYISLSFLFYSFSYSFPRRYFIKVIDQGENQNAQNMIGLIGQLYGIEKQIRESDYKPDKIKSIRTGQSDPIINEIRQLLDQTLHTTTPSGAKASANLYSIIETAKAHKLNPEEYLTNIYKNLPNAETVEDIEKLLPWNFKTD